MRPFMMQEDEEQLNQIPPLPAAPAIPPSPIATPPPQNVPRGAFPGMPPSVTADELQGYLSRQKQSLSKYGPEAQMNLQNKTLSDRDSLGSRLTSGAKGLGDALMQGVAGAGNPGWQQQYENRQDQVAREQMDTLQKADDGNLRRTASSMNIDRMDPGHVLSKSSQETYAPLFEKLGYSPESLKGMSGANIENAIALMAQFGGAEKQALIKEYELEIERARLEAMMGRQASDERMATEKLASDENRNQEKNALDAAEKLSTMKNPGFITKILGGESDEAKAAKKKLMTTMEGEAPYGDITERGGVQYKWSPTTKKYHRLNK